MALHRSTTDRMISGVCGGIAEEYNLDPTLVRLIAAALVLFTGAGLVVYILLAVLVPQSDGHVIANDAAEKASGWMKSRKPAPGQGQPYGVDRPIHNANDLR